VGPSVLLVPTLAENDLVANDHCAHKWIGVHSPTATLSKLYSALKVVGVV
jgi:hypothetical protein